MLTAALILFLAAFLTSLVITWLAKRSALRLGMMDQPGHRKVHTQITPRNGGIGIFWGIALPLLAALSILFILPYARLTELLPLAARPHIPGLIEHRNLAFLLIAATMGIHLLGLLDDRKALSAWPKLIAQLAIATVLVGIGEWLNHGAFRTLTFLDDKFPGGIVVSFALSVLWIVTLTNAFNFLDNMDGLSAGVAVICAGMFLIAAGSGTQPQWFICGMLLLFMGSVLGFLCYNFPPASIFMGDGGSMVLGFFLSALTIRTTYYHADHRWYTVLMPLVVLAVPLYDLIVVSFIRILQGKSPMVGDTNHFSHRLTRHGFSKRGAVLVIYAVTLACGISAPLLATANDVGAILIGIQCASMLTVIGILERVGEHTAERQKADDEIAAGEER